jgi:hypothetical protein
MNLWCQVCHVRPCSGVMCPRCKLREAARRMEADRPRRLLRWGLLSAIASLEAEGVAVIVTITPPRGAATEAISNE